MSENTEIKQDENINRNENSEMVDKTPIEKEPVEEKPIEEKKENGKDQKVKIKKEKKQKVKTKIKYIHPEKDNSPQAKLDFIIKASNDKIIYFLLYLFTILVSAFLFYIGTLTPEPKIIFFILVGIIMAGSLVMLIICLINIFKKDKFIKRYVFNNFFKPNFEKQKPVFKYTLSKEEGIALLGTIYDLNNKLRFKDYGTKIEIPFAESQSVTLTNLKEKSNAKYLVAICTLRNFISTKICGENSIPKHLEIMKVIENDNNKIEFTSANKTIVKKVLNNDVSKEIEKIIGMFKNVSLYIYKSNLFVLIKNTELLDVDSFGGKNKINDILDAIMKTCDLTRTLMNISNTIAQIDLMKKPTVTKKSKKK